MCFEWYSEAQSQNIRISGPVIQAKAKEIAISLGMSDFVASTGWLQKWLVKHNVSFRSMSKVASDTRGNTNINIKSIIPSTIYIYDLLQIP